MILAVESFGQVSVGDSVMPEGGTSGQSGGYVSMSAAIEQADAEIAVETTSVNPTTTVRFTTL